MKENRLAMGSVLLQGFLVAWISGCTVPNPKYCDLEKPCPEGKHCDLSVNRCVNDVCGNNELEPSEVCDGDQFGGQTCRDHGYGGGQLRCTDLCELDFQECTSCGNGIMEAEEECDGNDFKDQTCLTTTGKQQGTLACTSQCLLDTSGCHTCGDGLIEADEECDGSNLGANTCVSHGHAGGSLACTSNCTLDESGCFECGDDWCEGSKGEDVNNCHEDCAWSTISAGSLHTCAVKESGSVRCWGHNGFGQLGDGLTHQTCGGSNPVDCSPTAVEVEGLIGMQGVSSGEEHACAFNSDGLIWCWGNNLYGQLGDGTTTDQPVPVQVGGIGVVSDLASGVARTCAVTTGGFVWCWGNNVNGFLGNGSYDGEPHTSPVQVLGLENVESVHSGYLHSCALRADGAVSCWGVDSDGQLGDAQSHSMCGSRECSPIPVSVISNGFGISTGWYHSCAIVNDGSIWCWGKNDYGELGNTPGTGSSVPLKIQGFASVFELAAGGNHTCARRIDGTVWCWGCNLAGQLGDGNGHQDCDGIDCSPLPVQVDALMNVRSISAGMWHTCALTSEGQAFCWGANGYGQLGDGTTSLRTTPVPVATPY